MFSIFLADKNTCVILSEFLNKVCIIIIIIIILLLLLLLLLFVIGIGNHTVLSSIWNQFAQVSFSKS